MMVSALPMVVFAELALSVMVPAAVSVTIVLAVELAAKVVAFVELIDTPPFPAVAAKFGVVSIPVEEMALFALIVSAVAAL